LEELPHRQRDAQRQGMDACFDVLRATYRACDGRPHHLNSARSKDDAD